MIVLVGMGPRLSGLDGERFAEHWSGAHAELVLRLPGLAGYVQHHAVDGAQRPGLECLAELHFADLDALRAAFRSDVYRDLVAPDEERLVERSRMRGMRAEVVQDEAGDPGLAALILHRGAPGGPPPRTRRLVALAGDRSGLAALDVVALERPDQAPPGALLSRPRRLR